MKLNDSQLKAIFEGIKSIALVGISEKPNRASFEVAQYLSDYYQIIPVNPNLKSWLGLRCFASLRDIPVETEVGLVNVFRKSQDLAPIAEDLISRNKKLSPELRTKYFWAQLGISNFDAAKKLEASGVTVVMDECSMVEHQRLSHYTS